MNPFALKLLLLFALPVSAFSQPDLWLNYASRQSNYPESQFFTGFTSQYFSKTDDMLKLKELLEHEAKVQLSENVKVSIACKSTSKVSNVNSVSQEEFKKWSTSYTNIQLSGINTDFHINRKKKEAFAFAWIRKVNVITFYRKAIKQLLASIDEQLQIADQYIVLKEYGSALRTYAMAGALVRNIEASQAILLLCGQDEPRILLNDQTLSAKLKLAKAIHRLRNSRNLSLDEMASFLVASLSFQTDSVLKRVKVINPVYRDSGMGSEFSERFGSLLIHELSKNGFSITSPMENTHAPYLLSGNYWEDKENNLHVIINLITQETGEEKEIVASAEAWTTKKILADSKLRFKPDNFLQGLVKQEVFTHNETVNGGMKLEFWTNKGDDGLIFRQGEKLRLSVRVSKPAYLRIINYWADGSQVLMEENYYMDESKVNKVYHLPFEWETTCPCGVEFLQVNAQSTRFSPLNYRKVDELTYVEDDLAVIVKKTRDFEDQLEVPGNYMAEKRLTLTTLE